MRTAILAAVLSCALSGQALAWGQEGHSIIAEIAQHRLSPEAATMVEQLLGKGHSLAAIASWADDARDARPETSNWHFVSIPLARDNYDEAVDCHPADEATRGDRIVNELKRLRNELRCAPGDKQVEALKFAVHFVGDIHQPLHVILEKTGGNDIIIDLFARGDKCTGSCIPQHDYMKFHAAWDSGLILGTVWDWGRYVDLLETGNGWLTSPEAKVSGIDGGTPEQWAEETHKAAQAVWALLPENSVLGDAYYQRVAPIVSRQLGVAGLRLAKFLNDAYASKQCPVP
ncbi:S1/P1 Nuclease [Bradyrhizobium lablabi]|uniref:S1/P1 Nuclease n=1 Tax=Bradyrhizobium lablabi TaxID=722472 RepID=A0A1M6RX74_9BRAD|nr:S1/P1 nuclease [Bradyrhizobium lablabi]SHK37040.1 S1/P1 Nuclease [Bradyrhizobium lablabi]